MNTLGVQLKLTALNGGKLPGKDFKHILYSSPQPRPNGRGLREANRSEMSNFCPDQGRTRVFGEAYYCTPQPETRGERRSSEK